MNNPLIDNGTREIQRLFIKEAGGSFHIVHRALTELSNENDTKNLNAQDVIDRIHQIRGLKKRNPKSNDTKIPA